MANHNPFSRPRNEWTALSTWLGEPSEASEAVCIFNKIHPVCQRLAILTVLLLHNAVTHAQVSKPFEVPGHQEQIDALNKIQNEFGGSFTNCALWDAWIPYSTLWASHEQARRYRDVYLYRPIDVEGYVSMQQHRGMAHSEGWPFPAWQQSTGKGWHFSIQHEGWAVQNFDQKPVQDTDGWEIVGANIKTIDPARGLVLEATNDQVLISTPGFQCGTIVSPFVRLECSIDDDLTQRSIAIKWQLNGEEDFDTDRQVDFYVEESLKTMRYLNIPMYRHPKFAGLLNRLQVRIPTRVGSEIVLKSLITSIDTRHPITNSMFIIGSAEYFLWSGDIDFLRSNIQRMRLAMKYAIEEFGVQEHQHVYVPWVGHDGRSGLVIDANGQTSLRPGLGVGNNYWDLLPFGGHDALATIYMYDALRKLTLIESAIENRVEWQIPSNSLFSADRLAQLANQIKEDFGGRFWNRETERFVGWIDSEGHLVDYGFTFVNLEAIHYGLATEDQAKKIYTWLDGQRSVAGDTSTGSDIYHWRFGPRSTTRRNVENYVWAWSSPASIEWGGQVQDGGAVLGFSYFDLSARLKTFGPDETWARLQTVAKWKNEVDAAGGYRAYYAKQPGVTLQGCGTAGGLGIDCEFFESVLVPQILVRGFLGLQPTVDGFALSPQLPNDWKSLCIHDIHIRDYLLKCTAYADKHVEIQVIKPGATSIKIHYLNQQFDLKPSDTNLIFE